MQSSPSSARIASLVAVFSLLLTLVGAPGSSLAQGRPSGRAQARSGGFAAHRLLVKLRPGADAASLSPYGIRKSEKMLPARPGPTANGLDRLMIVTVDADDLHGVAAKMMREGLAEYAEPDYTLRAASLPNDPLFAQQWALRNTGQTGGTAGADIDAPFAWDTVSDGNGVVVGVIDTGIDYTHPDLAANIWTNADEVPSNGLDDDHNGYVDDVHGWDFIDGDSDPMDENGHGTHVAGTIAARGGNGAGVSGVAWTGKVAALRFLDASGSGYTSDAVRAIQYANSMGFKVTNNSWGGAEPSLALRDAIGAAAESLFVAAAGNEGINLEQYASYPASFPLANIISVAATDHRDDLAFFSNTGVVSVDLAAPGVDILSTVLRTPADISDPSGYGSISGTSMAAPHVSGAVALLWTAQPALSAAEAKAALMTRTDPVAQLAGKTVSGGRLNIGNLFDNDTTAPATVADLAVVGTTPLAATLSFTAPGDDGATGRAVRYDLRYATAPITAGNFDAAAPVAGIAAPSSAGTREQVSAGGLDPEQTYHFALRTYDNVGNVSGISNVVSGTTAAAFTAFSDTLEAGTAKWTHVNTAGSLWHVSTRRAQSPTHSWYFGLESTGNFDTGRRVAGSIISTSIDLTRVTAPQLAFASFVDAEDALGAYDAPTVDISMDNGAWRRQALLRPTGGAFERQVLDLSAYQGHRVRVRFAFDTIDDTVNEGEGWYLDDVRVLGSYRNTAPTVTLPAAITATEDSAATFRATGADAERDALRYDWDFGNGATKTTTVPYVSYAYPQSGAYTLRVTARDAQLSSLQASSAITVKPVNDAPVARITAPASAPTGSPVAFSAAASTDEEGPIASHLWSFGDGTTSTLSNPAKTYTTPGAFTVRLTVKDAGGKMHTASASIKITDVITITRAHYEAGVLTVEAKSTRPGTVLTVQGFGAYGRMTYSALTQTSTLKKPLASAPVTVTVTSPYGATATVPVTSLLMLITPSAASTAPGDVNTMTVTVSVDGQPAAGDQLEGVVEVGPAGTAIGICVETATLGTFTCPVTVGPVNSVVQPVRVRVMDMDRIDQNGSILSGLATFSALVGDSR